MASTTSTKGKTAEQGLDEVDAVFNAAGTDPNTGEDQFMSPDDLLDTVEEDDSEGWNPKEPAGVSGWVIKLSQTRSDFANDGEDPMKPTVTIQTQAGDKFRIIGFGSVLEREIKDRDPQVGDIFAVKFNGLRKLKTGRFAGKDFRHYSSAVLRPGQKGYQPNPHDQ